MLSNVTDALVFEPVLSRALLSTVSVVLAPRYAGPVPPTARERARAAFTADLLTAARSRLAADGPAHLSLRAVARDLGVASSAVYRYVPSRDALLTLLIIDAYDEVGAACERAEERARAAGAPPAAVFLEVARAFRAWALGHRSAFELVYGTPVPGYAAPEDTVPHAVRVWAVLVRVVVSAHVDGSWRPTGPTPAGDGLVDTPALDLGAAVAAASGADVTVAPVDVVRTFALFTAVLGAVTAELFGHLHRAAADHPRVFDAVVAAAAAGAGLHVTLDG